MSGTNIMMPDTERQRRACRVLIEEDIPFLREGLRALGSSQPSATEIAVLLIIYDLAPLDRRTVVASLMRIFAGGWMQ